MEPKDTEPRFDLAKLRFEIAQLTTQINRPWFRFISVLRDWVGLTERPLRAKFRDVTAKLKYTQQRQSGPRCLSCGNEGIQQLHFDQARVAQGFLHECGGRLYYAQPDDDEIIISASFKAEIINLDQEGRRISGVDGVSEVGRVVTRLSRQMTPQRHGG